MDRHPRTPRVLGLAGWSGAGKTTLLVRLIPELRARGLTVATVKHAHHAFDIDQPGKDSHAHRAAGAGEVIVASARRWAQVRELGEDPEATLPELLARLSPCDLILVEGYKREPIPKLEVHRAANGRPHRFPEDPWVRALASDAPPPPGAPPSAHLDDVPRIADLALGAAEDLASVLARLRGEG